MTTTRKLLLLTTLYLSQGLPFGFFTHALPAMLRQQGVSLRDIGLTSLLALPWALKFLWAPFVDRGLPGRWARFGKRRSVILPLQLAAMALMVGLTLVHPERALWILLVGVFLTNAIAATQDIATDGLAVSLLSHDERGLGNGVQVAGYRAGMIIGGGALLIVFDSLGYRGTFLSMAVLLGACTWPIFRWRESPAEASSVVHTRRKTETFLAWARVFRRPGMARWMVLLALYKGGDAFGTGMIRPFLVDAGLDLSGIGWLSGFGSAAALLGALLGGALVRPLGRRVSLVSFGLLQALAVLAWGIPALGWSTSIPTLAAISLADHLFGSMATAALFTLMMDACRTEQAGTDYTMQASVVVVATGLATTLSGASADAFGHATHFVLGALLSATGVLVMGALMQSTERLLASEQEAAAHA